MASCRFKCSKRESKTTNTANSFWCADVEACGLGCTDPMAENYDAEAAYNNGTCEYVTASEGCTDDLACNYDAEATIDDGSCEYAEEFFDCDGNCLADVDCNGTCGGEVTEDAWVSVGAIAQRTRTPMAAMTWTNASARWMRAACATAQVLCSSADAPSCLKATAIAMAASRMRLESAVAVASRTRMATAFATTRTTAGDRSTPWGCATATARPTPTATGSVTTRREATCSDAPSKRHATTTLKRPWTMDRASSAAVCWMAFVATPTAPTTIHLRAYSVMCSAIQTACLTRLGVAPSNRLATTTLKRRWTMGRAISPHAGFGCTDADACNYDPEAQFNDGSCEDANFPYDCKGDCVNDDDGDGVCNEPRCQDAPTRRPATTTRRPPTTTAPANTSMPWHLWRDCQEDANANGMCDVFEVAGCTDANACNYVPLASLEDGSCLYPEANYDGNCLDDVDGDGCDVDEVPGCTDLAASNYDPEATDDDGSCVYDVEGCTDETACNYNPMATVDDGACEYPEEFYGCDGNCLNDADGDGVCDELEVVGCLDESACNYNAETATRTASTPRSSTTAMAIA